MNNHPPKNLSIIPLEKRVGYYWWLTVEERIESHEFRERMRDRLNRHGGDEPLYQFILRWGLNERQFDGVYRFIKDVSDFCLNDSASHLHPEEAECFLFDLLPLDRLGGICDFGQDLLAAFVNRRGVHPEFSWDGHTAYEHFWLAEEGGYGLPDISRFRFDEYGDLRPIVFDSYLPQTLEIPANAAIRMELKSQ